MPNIPAVTQEPKPAEIPATEQNVSEMTSSIVGRYSIFLVQSARCLKITEKVSFNIASEASYFYILVDKS